MKNVCIVEDGYRMRIWYPHVLKWPCLIINGLIVCGSLCLSFSGTKVVLEQEIMLDGTTVSAAFDSTIDMGIVGTTAGTLWYINWSDNSSIRLVSGHKTKVPV